jgi:hypothetical protein
MASCSTYSTSWCEDFQGLALAFFSDAVCWAKALATAISTIGAMIAGKPSNLLAKSLESEPIASAVALEESRVSLAYCVSVVIWAECV